MRYWARVLFGLSALSLGVFLASCARMPTEALYGIKLYRWRGELPGRLLCSFGDARYAEHELVLELDLSRRTLSKLVELPPLLGGGFSVSDDGSFLCREKHDRENDYESHVVYFHDVKKNAGRCFDVGARIDGGVAIGRSEIFVPVDPTEGHEAIIRVDIDSGDQSRVEIPGFSGDYSIWGLDKRDLYFYISLNGVYRMNLATGELGRCDFDPETDYKGRAIWWREPKYLPFYRIMATKWKSGAEYDGFMEHYLGRAKTLKRLLYFGRDYRFYGLSPCRRYALIRCAYFEGGQRLFAFDIKRRRMIPLLYSQESELGLFMSYWVSN
ncbi:MAG TPA: hypothetical protein VM492_15475 [Sumerlaeia bacterium]|nr:hypothetical protein [Sumerlaeia bacterium]